MKTRIKTACISITEETDQRKAKLKEKGVNFSKVFSDALKLVEIVGQDNLIPKSLKKEINSEEYLNHRRVVQLELQEKFSTWVPEEQARMFAERLLGYIRSENREFLDEAEALLRLADARDDARGVAKMLMLGGEYIAKLVEEAIERGDYK